MLNDTKKIVATLPSDKKFGAWFSLIFMIICLAFLYKSIINIGMVFGVLSALTITATILKPEVLKPFNKLWFAFGLVLGRIISPLILGIVFFAVITPVSLFLRFQKRDLLRLHPVDVTSYWKEKEVKKLDAVSFTRQY